MHNLKTVALTLATMLGAAHTYAQSTTNASDKTQTQAFQPQVVQDAAPQASGNAVDQSQPSQDVPALDGAGIISMSSIRSPRLLVGGTIAGGYDSNPLNLGDGTSSALYSFSPYFGVESSTGKTQFLLQYHPTITRYSSYSGQTMHLAAARFVGSFTPRLTYSVGVVGSHGDDSLRLLGPSGPGSGSFLPNAGVITTVDGGIDLHYDASPRDSLGLHISDSYNSFPGLQQTGSVATASLNYNHSLKPTISLLVYEQSSLYYGDLNCIAVGAGVGIRWQPQESTLVSLRGGPQIDAPACKSQQGFSYSASVSRKLPGRSQFFVTANREPVISFLGSGLWQDDVSGGYQRQILSANVLSFDVGYVNSSTLVDASSYRGTFFDASYTHQLHRGISLGWSYRAFTGVTGDTDINRNILQFSLTVTPNTRTLSQ